MVKLKQQVQKLDHDWRLALDAGSQTWHLLEKSRAQNIELTERIKELSASREDALARLLQAQRDLQNERQATALLDGEVAMLKQEVDRLNVDSLPKTRRRLARRTAEMEELRKSLATANAKIAELESTAAYYKRTSELVVSSVQTPAHSSAQEQSHQG